MSSKCIVIHRIRSENAKFIRCWNIAGALVKPIGMTTYSYNPCGVKKAVLCFTYANLVVSMDQVDGAKHRSLSQMVKQVYNMGNWEYIELCLTI